MVESPTWGSYFAGAVVMLGGVVVPLVFIALKHRGLAWKPRD